jgi:hypothetical protein
VRLRASRASANLANPGRSLMAGMVPPPGSDADAEMRAHLTERIATVTPFLKLLASHARHPGKRVEATTY